MSKIEELLKNAKTTEELEAIMRELPKTDCVELSEDDLENVSGGGHIVYACGEPIWVELIDKDYQHGSDRFYDMAYLLENMAKCGFPVNAMVNVVLSQWGGDPRDIEASIRVGGPVYMADCFRAKHEGTDNGRFSW